MLLASQFSAKSKKLFGSVTTTAAANQEGRGSTRRGKISPIRRLTQKKRVGMSKVFSPRFVVKFKQAKLLFFSKLKMVIKQAKLLFPKVNMVRSERDFVAAARFFSFQQYAGILCASIPVWFHSNLKLTNLAAATSSLSDITIFTLGKRSFACLITILSLKKNRSVACLNFTTNL